MPAPNQLESLLKALRDAGVRASDGRAAVHGFPFLLDLAAWPPIVLDVPYPGLLALFDPATFGLAIVDATGRPRALWGLAERLPVFESRESLAESPVGGLVESALEGDGRTAFVDGRRYYTGAYTVGGREEALVLVADAHEEALSREVSRDHQVSMVALKRIGKVLSSKQSIRSLAIAALHAIFNTYDLSAAFLWVRTEDEGPLVLQASIGTTRGLADINRLTEDGKCIASLAAKSLHPLRLDDISKSQITATVEASICSSSAGSAIVLPLLSADRLIGVLELVAKKDDAVLTLQDDTIVTIAEHLALAIHNAMMFEENERLATYDPLTGIANHRTMQEFLEKRISEAERNGEKVGAVMVDVDDFRRFNEEEGHDAGDEVLKLVAQTLKAHIRDYDLAARYGGEEFTLLLANTDSKTVVEVAERVRTAIEELGYRSRSGTARAVTASFGCAVYPDSAKHAAGLLKAADQALYEAKRAGRNRTVLYTPGPKGRDLGDAA